ncbi:MAG TPA: MFS transporter [Thermoprotei archaeon]|nr:MAG: hypothetical protein DRJ63_03545 [Thermoprotei archaeon]HDI75372.1 MFS transporter [Thermoprotei archaeon]
MSSRRTAYSIILVIWIVAFIPLIGNCAQILSNTALTFKARELGFAALLIGSFTSAFMITRGILAVITGYIGDKIRRRGVFALIGFTLNALVSIGYALSTNWYHIIVLCFINGVASGILWPSIQTIVIEVSPRKWRSSIMSVYFSLGTLGGVVSYSIYALFYARKYFDAFLLSSAILGFLSISVIPLAKHYYAPADNKKKRTGTLSLIEFTIALTAMFSAGFITSTKSLLLLYLREFALLGEKGAANTMFTITLLSFLTSLGIGFLADKIGWTLSSIVGFSIGSILTILMETSKGLLLALALGVLLGAVGAMFPLTRAVVGKAKASRRGLLIGLVNFVGNIGSVLGPLILGFLYDTIGPFSLTQAYLIIALILITLFTIFELSKRKRP